MSSVEAIKKNALVDFSDNGFVIRRKRFSYLRPSDNLQMAWLIAIASGTLSKWHGIE